MVKAEADDMVLVLCVQDLTWGEQEAPPIPALATKSGDQSVSELYAAAVGELDACAVRAEAGQPYEQCVLGARYLWFTRCGTW